MDIRIIQASANQKKPKPADETKLGFGKYFSDHFYHITYHEGKGWHDPTIEPYRPLTLDPAAMVLHYAQEIFEGLKAYRGKDNGIYLFRPKDNLARLNRSAKRLCMPEVNIDDALEGMKQLVLADCDWIPTSRGTSMYIRPTMIATEASVGVKVSSEYLFYIIVGPAGAYYPEGFNPVKIYISDHYIRAARGGLGEAKTGANYAASLLPAKEAKEKGFAQVLWLDALELKYVEEVGTMNMFFRFDDEVVTSPLTGTILPGITRYSVMSLLKEWGVTVNERKISIDEVIDGAKSNRLKEAFGTGTAAIISPVGELFYKGERHTINQMKVGEYSQKLYDELLGIQYGEKPDRFGWVERIA